jgi:hypothetical protein
VNRKHLFPALAIVSWPIVFGALFLSSKQPVTGQRWADANPGRGSFLAATGFLWMTGVLLFIIWKVAFSLVVPRLAARNERARDVRDREQG